MGLIFDHESRQKCWYIVEVVGSGFTGVIATSKCNKEVEVGTLMTSRLT